MTTLWGVYAFVVGACFGSFLNVCISRWPDGLSVIRPRSRCPVCGRQLGAAENVPLLSWIVLRGRCRGCGTRISVQYPLVELATALVWLASYLAFGLTFTALRVAVLVTLLLGIAITDAKRYVIPDGFTVFGFVWVLLTSLAALFSGPDGIFAGPYGAIVGACAGAGAIAIAGWLGEVALKKEAMGFGDSTLMAVVGAAVGPGRALLTVFLAALLGALVFVAIVYPASWLRARSKNTEFAPPLVPFGVFLAPAAVVALLWGERLISTYVLYAGL